MLISLYRYCTASQDEEMKTVNIFIGQKQYEANKQKEKTELWSH